VRDDQCCAGVVGQEPVDDVSRLAIQVCLRLVEHQHRGSAKGRPGQGDTGPLTSRQSGPAVADRRMPALRQLGDQVVELA